MQELPLKYGCNPNQAPARVFVEQGALPIQVLNGQPGYINLLDALNGWQLVRELKSAAGLPAAASFKHVSPAGAAVGLPLSEGLRAMYFADGIEGLEDSPLACAYVRARGADRMSSFGDFAALSDVCDRATANALKNEVSDGVIAPGYTDEALRVLRAKRKGAYTILRIDPDYTPAAQERRQVFGVTFEQRRNDAVFEDAAFANIVTQNKNIPAEALRDLRVALIALKYTQSNSVCYAKDGQTIGVGAGQQSRIHCTRIAGDKADLWHLRQHPQVLALPFLPGVARPDRDNAIDTYLGETPEAVLADGCWQRLLLARPATLTGADKRAYLAGVSGVALASDAFFPFDDNIDRAKRSGVSYIAQPGGSVRDAQVIAACDRQGIAMAFTGTRLFHH
ncbi:MAG: phosphoribosylaminoimidazolecarboxamide formyltransferase [Christensenellaceae bacterium]|nr:phosphoribosylaminoimidazolecarboxamide formyltransferase [Christensenellaceae bacterium]